MDLFFAIRGAKKAFQKARWLRETAVSNEFERMDRIATQAAAYGFEVGRGQPLRHVLDASKDNPFLDRLWRNKVRNDV